jgi:peptide/nickel transport system substrate-binding protein/oligopeptide transport system substrate-binding protein
MRPCLVGLILLSTACGGVSGDTTLQYYLVSDPRSLDPALSTDVTTGEVITLLYDNLTQFDTGGRLLPGLATRWETDSAGLTYTFHLRGDAAFHDGRPLRAPEVAASFRRVLAPGASGGRTWPLEPIAGAREFQAGRDSVIHGLVVRDDSTLVLTLEEPLNIFPSLLALPLASVVPTPAPDDLGEHPVGSGPWRFVSWQRDDALVFARNNSYWGGAPLADSLRIRIIPEPLTQAAEYESGRLSVVEVPFGETARWEAERPAELKRRPALRAVYVAINTKRGPLADPRVRRALNHAVDVPAILRTVYGRRGVHAAGAIPPGIAGHDPARTPYPVDTAAARRLLREAGHGGGFSLKLWRTARPVYARVAESIQRDLGRLGIRVEIIERDAASARAAARKGETDLFLTDWYGDYPEPDNFTWPLFHSSNAGPGGNLAFLDDPELDQQIVRARQTTDVQEKGSLARAIDARIFEAAPWIFLWFPIDLWAARPEVEGWGVSAIFNGQRWTTVRIAR